MDAFEIEGVRVHRGHQTVIDDVTLSVAPGTIVALLGPNGAGKSSLVLAVAGILPLSGGCVRASSVDLTGASPARIRAAGVAAVPEGHRVLRDLSVRDNLRVAGDGLPRGQLDSGCKRVVELFPELNGMLGRRAGLLSGGEQQMLAIGQALVHEPKFLIIDELSLGLAPVVVSRLVNSLSGLALEGVGILLIEQFAEVALSVAEQAHVLDRGRLSFSGSSQMLRDHPDLLHTSYLRAA